jgi:hypothetical protein
MQQRDGPEIAEGIEGYQKSAGGYGGAQQGQGNLKKGGPRAFPKAAGCLFQGGVQTPQGGADRQQHVRIAE